MRKVFSNFIWKILERCGSQGVTIRVSIIMARLIAPSEFGAISMVLVITSILNVFIDSGLGTALIQQKEVDDIDFSSVFYFNVLLGLSLYVLVFLISPYISDYYDMPELEPIIKVLSLTLVISGLRNVQIAFISRKMQFKKYFVGTMFGVVVSAIVGVLAAYYGFGVWALVGQHLSNLFISTFVLWIIVKWHPVLSFSYVRLKVLLSYGWKLLISSLIDTLYENLRVLIIGKIYSAKDLAYYNQGAQIPYGVVNNINNALDSVLLPSISAEQDNRIRVKEMMSRAIKTSSFVIIPIMFALAAIAEPFTRLILTEKWLPAVPFLRAFCVLFMLYPINSANLNAIKALGRSDLVLKLEILKKSVGISVVMVTMWFSALMMAYGMVFCSFANLIINSWPNKKLLGYTIYNQVHDVLPSTILAFLMFLCMLMIGILNIPDFLLIIIQLIFGISFYVIIARILSFDSYMYIMHLLMSFCGYKK